MPIHVVCSGCKSSFNVSEKYAGKQGPCPKCKAMITVPAKSEEVVIHAPEPSAGKGDVKARVVFTPLTRKETRFSMPMTVGVSIAVLVVLVVAVALRSYGGKVPVLILALGAVLLGPPLAWAGYTFLRNDEFEPHRGNVLWMRAAACGMIYAALWGVYAAIPWVLDTPKLEPFQLTYVVPPLLAAGGFAAFASLDLEFLNGVLHYTMYLAVTVLLLLIMKYPMF